MSKNSNNLNKKSTLSKEEMERFRTDSNQSQPFYGSRIGSYDDNIENGIKAMAKDGFRISDAIPEEKGFAYCKK